MWKNWKDKIIDFFYEEVEEEHEVAEEIYQSAPKRSKTNELSYVDTKVAYYYPKKQVAPFRFPVIQDQSSEEKKITETHSKRQAVEQRILANQQNASKYKKANISLNHRKQKYHQKELENVPAYVRRRQEAKSKMEQQIKEEKITIQKEEKDERKVIPIDLGSVEHTTPEELDAVFRKRDGMIKPEVLPKTEPLHHKENELIKEDLEQASEPIELDYTVFESASNHSTSGIDSSPASVNSTLKGKKLETVNKDIDKDKDTNKDIPKATYTLAQHADEQVAKQDIPNYLLNDPVVPEEDGTDWLIEQQILLEDTLEHFHIDATVVNVTQGPSVTRFEVQPALGVKVSKIRNLADDMKLNLAAKDIRIEAPIPGKNTIGIEVPNQYPQIVTLQKLIETEAFQSNPSPLTIALGLSIEGKPLITNIGKMPHGLIAGATGSGKSVCINTIILSLLYKADYREVKLLLIDPKMVELTPYNGIPHLLSPVITDTKAATAALKWAVAEMETRYEQFVAAGVRNIEKYNDKMKKEGKITEKMPYIVIIIDELADLMMVSPQEVEDAICRIAQKARACGMHLLLATQRPSVDVITGLIKANIPTRIAFSVSSQVDSRTILDTTGAEKLLGKGDMLFIENGTNKSIRLQGPFVSDEEIDRVSSYTRSIAAPTYLFEQEQLLLEVEDEDEDELLSEVIDFVLDHHQASTSLLQRRFRIGYNRAARLIDSLEAKGIISGQNGTKPREVLVSKSPLDE